MAYEGPRIEYPKPNQHLVAGFRHSKPAGPIQPRFVENDELEKVLALKNHDWTAYKKLPASTKLAAAYYREAKDAAAKEQN